MDDIILVDDYSRDHTVKLAKKLALNTFAHSQNKGYGGNQKTCYKETFRAGADIVIMPHVSFLGSSGKLVEELFKESLQLGFNIFSL